MPSTAFARPFPAILILALLAGCDGTTGPAGMFTWPPPGFGGSAEDAAFRERRGAVEVIVKSEQDAVLADISAGGGPALNAVFDAARVPVQDRPTRVVQLQSNIGLYSANPGALVTAVMVYGG